MKTPALSIRFFAVTARIMYLCWLTLTLASGMLFCHAEDSKTDVKPDMIVGSVGAGQEAISFVTDSEQPEPKYEGVLISQWLQTNTVVNPKHLSLGALTTLKQVTGPDRMGIATFEVKVNSDAISLNSPNGANVDLGEFDDSGNFLQRCFQGVAKTTNQNCRVWWSVNYDPPREQKIRARLTYHVGADTIAVIGPPFPYDPGNVCQFIEGGSLFNSSGATFEASLREKTAEFRIELTTPKGKHLKTITGNTTNGMINMDWDLKDDHGKKFKGDSFEGAFYVIYPDDTRTNIPARDYFKRVADPNN